MALRESLLQPATKFLKDPKVADSPLAKKIAFLESKGLTSAEIEEAMRRSRGEEQTASTIVPPPVPPPTYISQQHSQAFLPGGGSMWKDLFIVATVVGGLGVGAYHLVKQYYPQFFGPQDNAENKQLKEKKNEEKLSQLAVEIQEIRELIPQVMERNKDSYSASLSELQSEIKSLKSLFLSRRTKSDTAESLLNLKPAIPSWQLAHTPLTKQMEETIDELEHDPAEEEKKEEPAKIVDTIKAQEENLEENPALATEE